VPRPANVRPVPTESELSFWRANSSIARDVLHGSRDPLFF